MNIFFIGGCRSGKSAAALRKAEAFEAVHRIFVATCRPYDDEMRARIARHQRERDAGWKTIEVPLELPATLKTHNAPGNVLLVDCLTLWVTNLMMDERADDDIEAQIGTLEGALAGMRCPVVLVANEVGQGIVPDNRMARQFRDWAGTVNQQVAACADQVYWMAAGIPMQIK